MTLLAEINMHDSDAIILVEGESDRAAVEAAADVLGCDLARQHIEIGVLGGATNFASALQLLTQSPGLEIVGLCDANEAALWTDVCGRHAEPVSFFVCERDLEDELLRACGVDRVERYIESVGELRGLQTMRKQGPWIDKPAVEQLHRFIRVKATRNIRYGAGLIGTLDADEIPPPIAELIRTVWTG